MGNINDCFSCFDYPNLIIAVKTGDTKGVGLHNCAFVTLIDDKGKSTQELCLIGNCFTVFKRGHTDVFTFKADLADLGPITKVKLVRSDLNDKRCVDWFVEKIELRRYFSNSKDGEFTGKEDIIFPINRWIRNKRPVTIEKFDCSLPQDDKQGEQRELEIFWKRKMYNFHRRFESLPPQVSFCPKDEVFSGNYKWDIMVRREAMMSKYRLLHYPETPWESFYEFDETFGKKLSTPAGRELWRDDFHFGRQRLCGANPTLITLCKVLPDNFTVTPSMVEPFLEGLSFQDAMETNRIFIVNLEILSRLNVPNVKIPSPYALFFLNGKKMLMPIALQLIHVQADDNPIFLPSDPWYTWTLAKMWYNNAEAQYHRSCSLIGFTHLFIEAVAVATHRNLSPSHPVFRLLAPFIRDIIPINCFEINELLAPGSWIDKCTSLGSQGTLDLLALGWQEWHLDVQGCLPRDLDARGVADPSVLPDYPYRDDSLPIYYAIESLVKSVILNKYIHPDILTGDSELRQWCIELTSDGKDGCSIKGIPGDGLLTSANELITVLSSIIFQSTVGNAAVNIPQYEEYGYIPNYPAFLKGSPPTDKAWREESSILDCLPPKNTSIDIMVVTKLLSERRTYGLANLNNQYLYEPDDVKAWERFFDDLKGISHTIQDSNRKRSTVYDYINPVRTFL